MTLRNGIGPVVASGGASAVKLLVATLAFAGAYLGVEATSGTVQSAERSQRAGQQAGQAEAPRRVTLSKVSARIMPVTDRQASAAGTISVTSAGTGPSCDAGLHVRALVRTGERFQISC